jgi:uncharacterized protein (DUF1697 family)
MAVRLAFIRGINVGGKTQVSMPELRRALSERGFGNVRTYIQSGNIVYDARDGAGAAPVTLGDEAASISAAVEAISDFAPAVMVRTADFVAAAFAASQLGDEDPAKSFMVFVDGDAGDLGDLDALAANGERVRIADGVIYLHCPQGIGRSKLGGTLAAAAKVPTTTRNLRTIAKLLELAGS